MSVEIASQDGSSRTLSNACPYCGRVLPPSRGRKPRTATCGSTACKRAYNTCYQRARRSARPRGDRVARWRSTVRARLVVLRVRIKANLFDERLECGHQKLTMGAIRPYRICRQCGPTEVCDAR